MLTLYVSLPNQALRWNLYNMNKKNWHRDEIQKYDTINNTDNVFRWWLKNILVVLFGSLRKFDVTLFAKYGESLHHLMVMTCLWNILATSVTWWKDSKRPSSSVIQGWYGSWLTFTQSRSIIRGHYHNLQNWARDILSVERPIGISVSLNFDMFLVWFNRNKKFLKTFSINNPHCVGPCYIRWELRTLIHKTWYMINAIMSSEIIYMNFVSISKNS